MKLVSIIARRFVNVCSVLLLIGIPGVANAVTGIVGAVKVGVGTTYTYSYDDNTTLDRPKWIAPNTSHISSYSIGTTYYADITFSSGTATTITLQDFGGLSVQLPVTIHTCTTIASPTAVDGTGCTGEKVKLYATPESSGTLLRWYDSNDHFIRMPDDDMFETPNLTQDDSYYVRRMEISTGCLSSRVLVNAIIYPMPDINAIPQTICTGSTSIINVYNNLPNVLNTWTVTSSSNVSGATAGCGTSNGSGIYNITQTLSVVSATANGNVTYEITPKTTTCTGVPVSVIIPVKAMPSDAVASGDQIDSSTCGLGKVTVSGTAPTVGTADWWSDSFPIPTIDRTSATTADIYYPAGSTCFVTWVVSNAPCPSTYDDVVIKFNQYPTAAHAGSDQTSSFHCSNNHVTLAANSPTAGTGSWSIVSGTGGYFSDTSTSTSTNPSATFYGTANTAYSLRWTISSDPCGSSSDDVVITFDQCPVNNYNYVREETVTIEGVYDGGDVTGLPRDQKLMATNYFDGLGRASQNVQWQISPAGNDVVQPVEYDKFGRESKKFLPYGSSFSNGWFKENSSSAQLSFYDGSNTIPDDALPVSTTVFEQSPLNRITKQYSPGSDWYDNDKATNKEYLLNTTGEVMLIKYNNESGISLAGNYSGGTLTCTHTIDEDHNDTFEYVDNQGRTVCKKVKGPQGVYAYTYYVYDDFGHLVVVIPPEGVNQILHPNGN